MKHLQTTTADCDDGLDTKSLLAGWPEDELPEQERPTLSLKSAQEALEQAGYEVLDSSEIRGRRNFHCKYDLARRMAPIIEDYDLLARHIQQVFVEAGFDMPDQNLVVGVDDGGNRVRVGFLAWFTDRR